MCVHYFNLEMQIGCLLVAFIDGGTLHHTAIYWVTTATSCQRKTVTMWMFTAIVEHVREPFAFQWNFCEIITHVDNNPDIPFPDVFSDGCSVGNHWLAPCEFWLQLRFCEILGSDFFLGLFCEFSFVQVSTMALYMSGLYWDLYVQLMFFCLILILVTLTH